MGRQWEDQSVAVRTLTVSDSSRQGRTPIQLLAFHRTPGDLTWRYDGCGRWATFRTDSGSDPDLYDEAACDHHGDYYEFQSPPQPSDDETGLVAFLGVYGSYLTPKTPENLRCRLKPNGPPLTRRVGARIAKVGRLADTVWYG